MKLIAIGRFWRFGVCSLFQIVFSWGRLGYLGLVRCTQKLAGLRQATGGVFCSNILSNIPDFSTVLNVLVRRVVCSLGGTLASSAGPVDEAMKSWNAFIGLIIDSSRSKKRKHTAATNQDSRLAILFQGE